MGVLCNSGVSGTFQVISDNRRFKTFQKCFNESLADSRGFQGVFQGILVEFQEIIGVFNEI